MAVRPLIRPKARVIAPAPIVESLEGLPRVLSRVCECQGAADHDAARPVSRQPTMIRPAVVAPAASEGSSKSAATTAPAATKPAATRPTLPAFWQSRKVMVAAGIVALITAVAIGYQFRPRQQIIVVHPAKQPAAVATSPANNNATTKPAFQPLTTTPLTTSPNKETTSTASLMPRATWPAEKTPVAAPTKNPAPQIQTATKPIDTRTSMSTAPAAPPQQENLPRMSPQFPQAPSPTTNSPSNAAVVYNPLLNAPASPLASGGMNQNNLPPQNAAPMYTAARPNMPQYNQPSYPPNYQPNMQPGQPMASPDGSFGAYGGARFEGQIQPLPLRR